MVLVHEGLLTWSDHDARSGSVLCQCWSADGKPNRNYSQQSHENLFCLFVRRQAEINSALVVLFGRGIKVEVCQQHLARMPRRHVIKQIADNGVILYLNVMAVFENQQGWRSFSGGSWLSYATA